MMKFYAVLTALSLSLPAATAGDDLSLQIIRHDGSVAYQGALESVGALDIRGGVGIDVRAADGGRTLYSGLLADVKSVTMTVATEVPSAVVEVAAPERGDISVTPHKADQSATVEGVGEGTEISVFDIQGKMVRRGVAPVVSLGGIPPGLYIFRAGNRAAKVVYK